MKPSISPQVKDKIVAKARVRAQEIQDEASEISGQKIENGSLFTRLVGAAALIEILNNFNIAAVLQAGTCIWPRVGLEELKGQLANPKLYFAHCWESMDEHPSAAGWKPGQPLTAHVWVALAETCEIVDIATRHFVHTYRVTCDDEWTGPSPPDYFWSDTHPEQVFYLPYKSAILFFANVYERFNFLWATENYVAKE